MKTFLILTISLFIALSMSTIPSLAAKAITNAEFAELLMDRLGIELPAGSEDLPAEEYFEVMSNALAANGIPNFVNAKRNGPITYAEFVEVMYTVVGGKENITTEQKLKYLVANINMPEIDLTGTLTLARAIEILSNPATAPLIAEAFTPLAAGGTAGQAPGFTLEDTASQT